MPFDYSVMTAMPRSSGPFQHGEDVVDWQRERGTPEGAAAYERFRCDLLNKVRLGELTPTEGEQVSRDTGGEPFEVKFEISDGSPKIATWTPEMVASWILKKDLRLILRHHEQCYTGKSIWVENENVYRWPLDKPAFLRESRRGHDLIRLGRTSLFAPSFYFDGRRFDYSDLRWFQHLREFLVEGKLIKAAGTEIDSGHKVPISPGDWQFLEFAPDEDGSTILKQRGSARYRNVTFLARSIRRVFPAAFTQQRITVTNARRWKDDLEKQPKGKRLMFYNVLKEAYPDGFPLTFQSESERLATIRELCGELCRRQSDDALKRYLNGLLQEYCGD